MPALYDISFTTKVKVSKFDAKGRKVGESEMNNPVVMTMLPYNTAMSYKNSGCENFTIKPSVFESGPRKTKVKNEKGEYEWAMPATKAIKNVGSNGDKNIASNKKPIESEVSRAAQTGDMRMAIND